MAQQVNPEDIAKAIQLLIQNAQNEGQPFVDKVQKTDKITIPSTADSPQKELKGYKTDTFLDMMFLDANEKPIQGVPKGSNSILTGLPNSGKSLLIEQIALKVANSGRKVVLVISEDIWKTSTERYDLESRMRERAKILGLDWNIIATNLSVIDTVAHAELREWTAFVQVYRSVVENEKADFVLVDSMTLLEDVRGQIKYRVLELMRYNQTYGITSILVNQRAIEEADSLAMAGGISLSHIVDIVFLLDYKKVSSWDAQIKQDVGAKQSETVNFFRILKCRLCRFDAHYFGYQITKDGLVELLQKPTTV